MCLRLALLSWLLERIPLQFSEQVNVVSACVSQEDSVPTLDVFSQVLASGLESVSQEGRWHRRCWRDARVTAPGDAVPSDGFSPGPFL